MAKNKKKGFFSWLGFGNKEQEPQQPEAEEQLADDGQAPAEPAVEEVAEHIAEPEAEPAAHSEEETQAFADEVVEVTQEVVQQESVALPEAAVEPAPTVEPEPVAEAEVIVAPEPVAGAIPAAPLQDADIFEEMADEPALSDEELEALALAAADESEQAEDDVQETQQEQEKPTKEGFFARLKRSLLKTKENRFRIYQSFPRQENRRRSV